MLADFYPGCRPDAMPSFGQFSYWLARDGTPAAVQHGLHS
jgi:hypothetical protein